MTFRVGDRVVYAPPPGETPTEAWALRSEVPSVVVDLPGEGRAAYGMALVGPVEDRWFAIPELLERIDD